MRLLVLQQVASEGPGLDRDRAQLVSQLLSTDVAALAGRLVTPARTLFTNFLAVAG